MSAIQINKYNQESLATLFNKKSLDQADEIYAYEHFKIGKKEDDIKTKTIILLTSLFNNTNCEVSKFLDKILRGALDDTNLEIADLKTVQTKYRDINNYYNTTTPFLWENSVQW